MDSYPSFNFLDASIKEPPTGTEIIRFMVLPLCDFTRELDAYNHSESTKISINNRDGGDEDRSVILVVSLILASRNANTGRTSRLNNRTGANRRPKNSISENSVLSTIYAN